MNDLISVIVPVYKVEPYLRKCVDSILNQTYSNLEVILVDDGSPDNCGAICDEYAAKDSRVKVIHKENGGLSDARNAGLDAMRGEYVAFVDSDDWIDANMFNSLMYNLKSFGSDVSVAGVFVEVEVNGIITESTKHTYAEKSFFESNERAIQRYLTGAWSAWGKVFNSNLFSNLRFPINELNEDEAIVLNLYSQCKRICYSNETFYHYMQRPHSNSITASKFSSKKLAWVNHCKNNLELIKVNYPELEEYAISRYRHSIVWALREIILSSSDFSREFRQLKKELMQNAHTFEHAPFINKTEKLHYYALKLSSPQIYKFILRIKQRFIG